MLREKMKLRAALIYMDMHKSSYAYKSRLGLKRKRPYILDHSLEEALKALEGYELTMGYDKTATYIRDKHRRIWNRKKVYLHMKALKLLQPKKIKRRWMANKRLPVSCAIASNVRWEADLTFVSTQTGHAYLFAVEDVYDREALSGHMDLQCGATQAIAALREALDRRFGVGVGVEGLRLTVRVDRGCQFTAEAFEAFAKSRGVELEFCGVQTPNDKPYIESFIGCYKREEVYRNQYENFFEAYEGWKKYMVWYNRHRPHGSLGNMPPVVFRKLKESNLSTKAA